MRTAAQYWNSCNRSCCSHRMTRLRISIRVIARPQIGGSLDAEGDLPIWTGDCIDERGCYTRYRCAISKHGNGESDRIAAGRCAIIGHTQDYLVIAWRLIGRYDPAVDAAGIYCRARWPL